MHQSSLAAFISVIMMVFQCFAASAFQRSDFPTASDYALEHKNYDGQPTFTPIL